MSGQNDLPPTAFGSVSFDIMWGDNELAMADFESTWLSSTRHVPNSDRVITQLMGKGPTVATYRLEFASVADFRSMEAKVQTADTLRLFYGMTTAPGAFVRIIDDDCLEIANVTLLALANRAIYLDGCIEADATFMLSSS